MTSEAGVFLFRRVSKSKMAKLRFPPTNWSSPSLCRKGPVDGFPMNGAALHAAVPGRRCSSRPFHAFSAFFGGQRFFGETYSPTGKPSHKNSDVEGRAVSSAVNQKLARCPGFARAAFSHQLVTLADENDSKTARFLNELRASGRATAVSSSLGPDALC